MTFIPRDDIKNPKREQCLVGGFTFGAAIVACEEMTSKDPNKIRALTPVDSSFRLSILGQGIKSENQNQASVLVGCF